MEVLYNFVNTLTPLSTDTFKLLKPYFKKLNVKANTVLCKDNDEAKNVYFLINGVARTSSKVDDNKVFTRTLHTANQFFGPYSNLINNEKSNLIYEALTDCEVIEINHKEILEQFGNLPEMMKLEIKILQNLYDDLQKTVISLGTLNAKERYIKLLKRINGIEELIPQYQIASYLGVTPIQLSRIRRSLYK